MSAAKGNPQILIRVDRETLDKAHKLFPPVKGRSGGVPYALRRLLHVLLEEPIPKQYGEIGRSELVDDIESGIRGLQPPLVPEILAETVRDTLEVLKETEDPVDKLRLRAALGHLMELNEGC